MGFFAIALFQQLLLLVLRLLLPMPLLLLYP